MQISSHSLSQKEDATVANKIKQAQTEEPVGLIFQYKHENSIPEFSKKPFPGLPDKQPLPGLPPKQPHPGRPDRKPVSELPPQQPLPGLPDKQPLPGLPPKQP